MNLKHLAPVSEDAVKAAAHIIGPHGAAAKALEDAARRRDAAETVEFFTRGGSIFVRGTPGADVERERPST